MYVGYSSPEYHARSRGALSSKDRAPRDKFTAVCSCDHAVGFRVVHTTDIYTMPVYGECFLVSVA